MTQSSTTEKILDLQFHHDNPFPVHHRILLIMMVNPHSNITSIFFFNNKKINNNSLKYNMH